MAPPGLNIRIDPWARLIETASEPAAYDAASASIHALIVEAFHAMQRDDKWTGGGRRPAARYL